jgi:hypothetical protein
VTSLVGTTAIRAASRPSWGHPKAVLQSRQNTKAGFRVGLSDVYETARKGKVEREIKEKRAHR